MLIGVSSLYYYVTNWLVWCKVWCWLVVPVLIYHPLTIKLKFIRHLQILVNSSFCFIGTKLTGIWPLNYVLSMLSSYLSCDIHFILKSFLCFVYIRVIHCTTLDPGVGSKFWDDVNLDGFFNNQGGGGVGLRLFWGVRQVIITGRMPLYRSYLKMDHKEPTKCWIVYHSNSQ